MKVVCRKGSINIKKFKLRDGTISVGRHKTNDIVLKDPSCSRFHFKFVVNDGIPHILNISKLNPIFINNNETDGLMKLKPHDIIAVGNSIFITYDDDEKAPKLPASKSRSNNIKLTDKDEVTNKLKSLLSDDLNKVHSAITKKISASDRKNRSDL